MFGHFNSWTIEGVAQQDLPEIGFILGMSIGPSIHLSAFTHNIKAIKGTDVRVQQEEKIRISCVESCRATRIPQLTHQNEREPDHDHSDEGGEPAAKPVTERPEKVGA